jgi:hypothetical protein
MQHHPPAHVVSALCSFLFWAFGEVSPEEDDCDEKDDYDDIFDVVCLEEVHIAVKITHHPTSFGAFLSEKTHRSIAAINCPVK